MPRTGYDLPDHATPTHLPDLVEAVELANADARPALRSVPWWADHVARRAQAEGQE